MEIFSTSLGINRCVFRSSSKDSSRRALTIFPADSSSYFARNVSKCFSQDSPECPTWISPGIPPRIIPLIDPEMLPVIPPQTYSASNTTRHSSIPSGMAVGILPQIAPDIDR